MVNNFYTRISVILYSMIYLLLSGYVGRVEYEPFNGLSLATLFFHITGTLSLLYVCAVIIKDMKYFKQHFSKDGNRKSIQ